MEAIAKALAANLSTATGVQVTPYVLTNPGSPTSHVFPSAIEYDLAGSRGLDRWIFTCQVMIGLASDIGAQLTLYKYLSEERSVKTAVESDPQLGGRVADLRVTRCGGVQFLTVEGRGPYVAAEWSIEVYVPGA